MGPVVLVSARSFGQVYRPAWTALQQLGCELVECREGPDLDQRRLMRELARAEAWIFAFHPMPAQLLDQAPRLRVLVKHGVGLDNLDLDAASARGIQVCTAPGSTEHSVPEHALALLFALARRIVPAAENTRSGGWSRFVGTGLHGKTLGIIGLGRIGASLARKAMGLDMRILGYDPFADQMPPGVERATLEQVLTASHCLCLCCPLTDATRGLLTAERLALLPPGALVVNTARGEVVDETALLAALESGRLGGYAADVFSCEPPAGNPLLRRPDVIATPHMASYSEDSLRLMGERVVAAVRAMLDGSPQPFPANNPALPLRISP